MLIAGLEVRTPGAKGSIVKTEVTVFHNTDLQAGKQLIFLPASNYLYNRASECFCHVLFSAIHTLR